LLHNHPHLLSGAGTIGQKWPQYKGLSPTPLAIIIIMYSPTLIAISIKWTFVTILLRIFQNEEKGTNDDVRILRIVNVFGAGVTLIGNKMGDAALTTMRDWSGHGQI
jgi:hypothetical protein